MSVNFRRCVDCRNLECLVCSRGPQHSLFPKVAAFDFFEKEFWASQGVSSVKWDADSTINECFDCKAKFTMTRRKHHCRVCGHIFCDKCSKSRVYLTDPATGLKDKKQSRVCDACKNSPALADQA